MREQYKGSWSQTSYGIAVTKNYTEFAGKQLWWSPILIQKHDFKFPEKDFIKDDFVKKICSFFQKIPLGNCDWTKKNSVCNKYFLKIQHKSCQILSRLTGLNEYWNTYISHIIIDFHSEYEISNLNTEYPTYFQLKISTPSISVP